MRLYLSDTVMRSRPVLDSIRDQVLFDREVRQSDVGLSVFGCKSLNYTLTIRILRAPNGHSAAFFFSS